MKKDPARECLNILNGVRMFSIPLGMMECFSIETAEGRFDFDSKDIHVIGKEFETVHDFASRSMIFDDAVIKSMTLNADMDAFMKEVNSCTFGMIEKAVSETGGRQ